MGDFTGWSATPIPLMKRGHDLWAADLRLPTGVYHYRFIVDGRWCSDPANPRTAPNPYGTENSVCEVH